ncbi:MAG: squalene/phytoene synthase family protein [Candidatus Zixiibacteriota bacterium]|nr:MAG: squalene/phytoene synthase family protein [candidate division Zixibacteria bacterium]
MVKILKTNDSFIQEHIPRVSRTFALTIKFLPRGLRNSVYTSYLLCRVADTLEDTPYLIPAEKSKRLLKLRDLLLNAAGGRRLDLDAVSSIYESVDTPGNDEQMLLVESSRLFEILETLPGSHKKIIYRWVGEMAEGMADYSKIDAQRNDIVVSLKNVEDWDRYCYYVAGTVGHMLTELFIVHYDFNMEISEDLKRLGNSFGLGLQKVNVIKDVPDDRERGINYLPGDILNKHRLNATRLKEESESSKIELFINEIVSLTVPHLDDAIEYSALIPQHLKGVRMFLIVPVFLAVETLSLIKSNPVRAMIGPPVKLTRSDVTRLVGAAATRVGSNKKLKEYYRTLRDRSQI